MEGKIVRHLTRDGLYLNGLFNEKKTDKAFFYTHGWGGDFYRNPFYDSIANVAERLGHAFLIAQNRGSGYEYDFLTQDGKDRKIGANHERFEDCFLDFEAWLYFLYLKGYKEIVFVGHSFACHKMAYFYGTKQHAMVRQMILLSPFDIFDKFGFLLNQDQSAVEANLILSKKMIDEGREMELMPSESLWFPISAGGFYDHFGPESRLHIFDFLSNPQFDGSVLSRILVPTLVVLGEKDQYVRDPKIFMQKIQETLPSGTSKVIKAADHSYTKHLSGLEETMFEWLKGIGS